MGQCDIVPGKTFLILLHVALNSLARKKKLLQSWNPEFSLKVLQEILDLLPTLSEDIAQSTVYQHLR